ncbi:MAG: hypothetical protein RLZZ450_6498 [Pseudomonadota bacterium]|jgi:hypothetical protein
MNKRGIVVLGLVATLLLAYVLVFERASVTSKERSERSGRVLVSFVREKVERLSVQRNGTRVVLARTPRDDGTFAGFRVLEPYAAKADDDAVDQVLGELEWLSARRTLDAISPQDEQRFGLATPRYRVSFEAGRDKHTLSIGHGDVHGDGVYVRVDAEPRAFVVPKSIVDVLAHEPGHFRDKQLFPDLTVAWVRKLDVVHGASQRHFSKDEGRWWIAEAPKVYADHKRIDELLHTVSELRAAHYLEPGEQAAAQAALSTDVTRLEIAVVPDEAREDKKPRTPVLTFGGPCRGHAGERYVRSEPGDGSAGLLVCVSAADLEPLELGNAPLQELRLFASELSAVQSFVLSQGKQKLALAREGESWKAQSGSAAESVGSVDREGVEAWLADLAAARALRFVPTDGFLAQGSLTLELADQKREQLAFGALNAQGELPVRRGSEPTVAVFPASVFDRLEPSPGRFGSLELWAKHQPSEVVKIEAHAPGRSRSLTLDAGQWRVAALGSRAGTPATPAPVVDSERVRETVRALVDLRARSYESAHARPGHGISKETGLALGLQDGSSLTLELGAATDRGMHARVTGVGGAPAGAEAMIVEVGADVVAAIVELAGGPRAPAPAALDAEDTDEDDEAEHEGLDEHEH